VSANNPSTAGAGRLQHLLPACIVLLLALIVTWLSYTREPADAFLFPRLISSVMVLLAIWNVIRAAAGLARVGEGLSGKTLSNIAPGVGVMLLLVYVGAKALGFYVASFLAYLCVYSMYDPASHRDVKSWLRRLWVTALFMAVIYVLFSLLLKVQTPRGVFF